MQLSDPAARLSLVLRPAGYQFPGAADVLDRNWLEIDGHVTQRRNVWTFTEPCLTTTEAAGLAAWLRAVADRTVPPQPDPVEIPSLTFTEPNLAFSVATYGSQLAVLRVHLSLECAPPWEQDGELFGFHLRMSVGTASVRAAAEHWEHDLAPFPPRT